MAYDDYQASADQGGAVLLFLFETENGYMQWAYTTNSRPVTVNGVEYLPEAIRITSQKQSASNETVDEMVITVPYDNAVAIVHVPYLPVRPVKVTVYSYQRNDATAELNLWFAGSVVDFNQQGVHADLRCWSSDAMATQVPWPIQKPGCVLATYSERCGVDKAAFATEVGQVLSFAGTTIQAAAFATKPDGWFSGGYIEDTVTGEARFITEHVGDTIKVVYPLITLDIDSVLTAYAGDDHTASTCHNKFNNKVNYLGHDHVPNFNVFVEGTGRSGSGGGGGGGGSGGSTDSSAPWDRFPLSQVVGPSNWGQ